ncbi:MAG: hypothetical protein Q4B67_09835 [Eubacteriales bacterium]|nr:hypothetical protein [Eubacteriales bacterium]
MGVIKDEYISDKVTRFDMLPLSFLKKSAYTGSKGNVRYRIEKKEEEERKFLFLSVWTTPFAYDKTNAEDMETKEFDFSDKGIDEIVDFLNENYIHI